MSFTSLLLLISPSDSSLLVYRNASELCGLGSEGITRVGWTMLAELIENTDSMPACTVSAGWEESSTKSQWHLTLLLSRGRIFVIPSSWVFALKLAHLIPHHISLSLFELLPLHWSLEWVRLCAGSLRAVCLGLPEPFVSLKHNSSWFSQPDVMGTSAWTGELAVGL